ncbi:MAG: hypothetical protein R3Y65_03660 [Bacillota bacterium]
MKIAFLIIWTVVGWLCGVYICKDYKKRVEILQEISDVATVIEENITHFKRPTAEILLAYPFKTPLSDILLEKSELGGEMPKETADLKALLLEIETCETVTAKSKLEAFEKRNQASLENAKKQLKQKGETSQKLGILFGLLVGILWL